MDHPPSSSSPRAAAGLRSDFLRILAERGFLHQCTALEALDARLSGGRVTAYIGFDATADSLHVGHLLQIMALRWLQRCGHRPIVLIGGGTTKIGDPSFRDGSRPMLSDEQIARNMVGVWKVFDRFLAFGGGETDAIMANNADWLDELRYIGLLRDIGAHFTVNRMLSFDSVKSRLDRQQPLSFLEFNYMILQAYDFLELSRRHGCVLQMGGSDQWGNIVNGVELARRIDQTELFGLTTPLLTTAAGAKMGKTAAGAVWLNASRLPPFAYWQFWRNTEDADVGRFLRLFTELPLDEVDRLAALRGAELNEAKKVLATEATAMAHGRAAALEAAGTARQAFERGERAPGLPSVEVPRQRFREGIPVVELLILAGLAGSKSEARRLIGGRGARLNDRKVLADTERASGADLDADGLLKLSVGRRRQVVVRMA